MQKETTKKLIVLAAVVLFLIVGAWWTNNKEQSLENNRKVTIGNVTDFKFGVYGYIHFTYYVDGKLFEGSDPDDASWPEYVREAAPKKHGFYPVEYDVSNPKNCKIAITKNPWDVDDLFRGAIQIEGVVEHAYPISDNYVDLHINYSYLSGDFKFRTRLHKDSLPCGTLANCEQAEIELFIPKNYPELSDLYLRSYDRIAKAKAAEKNK
ncbi:hypothetical protein [Flagellimonas myxillae]|uniref:hypothetical protein n=1 Tax=Flagellimonas myxillae TaxID=2942214 RepID=UPI00201F768D|nr:hypothetical protein [Muricauda myxillae]MCL6267659.1 hypothetical protein [Muricauda myxillae]